MLLLYCSNWPNWLYLVLKQISGIVVNFQQCFFEKSYTFSDAKKSCFVSLVLRDVLIDFVQK